MWKRDHKNHLLLNNKTYTREYMAFFKSEEGGLLANRVAEPPINQQKSFITNDNGPANLIDLQKKIAEAMERARPATAQVSFDNNVPARSSFSSLAEAIAKASNDDGEIPVRYEAVETAHALDSYLKQEVSNDNKKPEAVDSLIPLTEAITSREVALPTVEEGLHSLLKQLPTSKLEELSDSNIIELNAVAAGVNWLDKKLKILEEKSRIEEATEIEITDLHSFAEEIKSLIDHAAETMNSSAGSSFANTLIATLDKKLKEVTARVEARQATAEVAINEVGEAGEMPVLHEEAVLSIKTLVTMTGRTDSLGKMVGNPSLVASFTGGKIGNRFPISQIDALKRVA